MAQTTLPFTSSAWLRGPMAGPANPENEFGAGRANALASLQAIAAR
jgi:hypothetical protein